jgi:hypothetical protein
MLSTPRLQLQQLLLRLLRLLMRRLLLLRRRRRLHLQQLLLLANRRPAEPAWKSSSPLIDSSHLRTWLQPFTPAAAATAALWLQNLCSWQHSKRIKSLKSLQILVSSGTGQDYLLNTALT